MDRSRPGRARTARRCASERRRRSSPGRTSPHSLTPNGSTLDYVADAPYRGRVGVEKKSLIDGLYLVGCALNFCAPAGADPDADLTNWKNRLDAGEPYDGDPARQ